MKIIYVSKTCSKAYFSEIYDTSAIKPQQQDQKFNLMFIEGLRANQVIVESISSRPINRTNLKRFYFKKKLEEAEGVQFHYLSFINIRIFRQLTLFINCFFVLIRRFIKNRKDTYVFCDTLNFSTSLAVIMATRLYKIKSVAVVTDLPLEFQGKPSLYKKVSTRLIKKYDRYIILSESMDSMINKKHRPSLVLEGMVYPPVKPEYHTMEDFIIMYAGGITSNSGIDTFIEAFIAAKIEHSHLIICGLGDLHELVKTYAEQNVNIRYLGSLKNDEIIQLERSSTLLINPRPTNLAITKYAFPSKIMEYLASGTPVLSTRLSGIPREYAPFLFFFEDETIEGMKQKLIEISQMDRSMLQTFGKTGYDFVFNQKTNLMQSQRVLKWLQK